jgi:hypothetical protein
MQHGDVDCFFRHKSERKRFFKQKMQSNIKKFSLHKNLSDTGSVKSHATEKQSNIFVKARANGLIFLSIIKPCSHSISIKTRL